MASDSPGDTSVSVNLPESLSGWLDDKAAEEGRSREDVLLQLLSAYRKVDGLEDGDVTPPPEVSGGNGLPTELEDELAERVDDSVEDAVRDRIDEELEGELESLVADLVDRRLEDANATVGPEQLDRRVEDVESRFQELLEDVRDRVVQVKRETDGKAPEDHDHPDLAAAVEALDGIDDDVATVESAVDRLESRMEAGFDNYEEVLQYLADSVDEVANRQSTLAKALVETREELRKLAARDRARSATEDLQREASQRGVRTAACEECDSEVDVGLLTRAECPHCSAPFVGVEPARGFFGSATLATGNRPELAAGDPDADGFEHDVGDIAGDRDGRSTSDHVEDDIGDVDGAGQEDSGPAGDGDTEATGDEAADAKGAEAADATGGEAVNPTGEGTATADEEAADDAAQADAPADDGDDGGGEEAETG